MELQEFTPEKREFDIPLDDFPETPPKGDKPTKKKWRRLWLLLPAILLVAATVFVSVNFTSLAVRFFPHYALNRGIERVAAIPERAAVGVLGEVRRDGTAYTCAGLLRFQTGKEGLALAAEDFTLTGGELDLSFSGYLSAHDAALSAPGLTGGSSRYYGVSLDEPILDQTAHTGGDPDYGWYYNAEEIAAFQSAADAIQDSFAQVTGPLSAGESQGLKDYIKALDFTVRREDEGYTFTATADEEASQDLLNAMDLGALGLGGGETAVHFALNRGGVLTGLSLTNEALELDILLGSDPTEELSPWLSLRRLKDGEESFGLTLALTVEESRRLEVPHYTNAFTLLPRVDLGE